MLNIVDDERYCRGTKPAGIRKWRLVYFMNEYAIYSNSLETQM